MCFEHLLTFSVERSVSLSCFFCVKTIVKTAWDLLLVSFMLVAATVLEGGTKLENDITWTHAFLSAAAIIKYYCYTKGLGHSYNFCYWVWRYLITWAQQMHDVVRGMVSGRYWLFMPCSRNKPSESAQEDWGSAAPPQTSSCDTCMHQSHSLILISSLDSSPAKSCCYRLSSLYLFISDSKLISNCQLYWLMT